MTYAQETQTAIAAVGQAAALCRAVQQEMANLQAMEKGDRSPVTVADYASQALICRQLQAAFPQDPIVAEEDAAALSGPSRAPQLAQVVAYVQRFAAATAEQVCTWIDLGRGRVGGRFWTVDPIDGTQGFLRHRQYAVALALIEGGQVQVGVLGCPALPLAMDEADSEVGALFVAVRGQGAAMAALGDGDLQPIRVAQGSDPRKLRLVESVEEAHGNAALQEAIAEAVGMRRPALRLDGQVKYGVLARGDAALYLRLPSPGHPDYREKIWDHAAGALIVEEAGGRVTDMYGRALDLAAGETMRANRGVIAGNGTLHEAVLRALAERVGAEGVA